MSTDQQPTDVAQAIRDFRAGKTEAFNTLVKRYEDRLKRSLERRLGRHRTGLNTNEDLAQSVFRNLYAQMSSNLTWIRDMESAADFEGVLFHLATLRLLRAIQAEERECRRGTVHGQTEALPDRATGPTDEAEANLLVEEWRVRLAQVDPDLVPIFELRVQGYQIEEIVARVGLSRRTVQRGIQTIQTVLGAWREQTLDEMEAGHDS
jgi:RNA polymerase sigma factor (sigma-70 family)